MIFITIKKIIKNTNRDTIKILYISKIFYHNLKWIQELHDKSKQVLRWKTKESLAQVGNLVSKIKNLKHCCNKKTWYTNWEFQKFEIKYSMGGTTIKAKFWIHRFKIFCFRIHQHHRNTSKVFYIYTPLHIWDTFNQKFLSELLRISNTDRPTWKNPLWKYENDKNFKAVFHNSYYSIIQISTWESKDTIMIIMKFSFYPITQKSIRVS